MSLWTSSMSSKKKSVFNFQFFSKGWQVGFFLCNGRPKIDLPLACVRYLHIGLPHIVMLKYSQISFFWFSDSLMLINMTLQHRSETLNCPTRDINMFPCQRFKGFNFANVQICNKSQKLILNMKEKIWAKREWKQRHFVSLQLLGWVKVHCC